MTRLHRLGDSPPHALSPLWLPPHCCSSEVHIQVWFLHCEHEPCIEFSLLVVFFNGWGIFCSVYLLWFPYATIHYWTYGLTLYLSYYELRFNKNKRANNPHMLTSFCLGKSPGLEWLFGRFFLRCLRNLHVSSVLSLSDFLCSLALLCLPVYE